MSNVFQYKPQNRSSEQQLENREALLQLFQNSPLPPDQLLTNLALYVRSGVFARLLFLDGARMTMIGLAIGFPLAVMLGRLLSTEFFDTDSFDPIVLTLAPLVLAAAATLATYLPARRGMRISPLDALRME